MIVEGWQSIKRYEPGTYWIHKTQTLKIKTPDGLVPGQVAINLQAQRLII